MIGVIREELFLYGLTEHLLFSSPMRPHMQLDRLGNPTVGISSINIELINFIAANWCGGHGSASGLTLKQAPSPMVS